MMILDNVNRLRSYLLAASFGLFVGCGGVADPKWPPPVPFTGTVTLDGKPLADAHVIFIPEASTKGQGGTGTTDASGEYSLTSSDGKGGTVEGVIPGSYKVFFSKMLKPDGSVWTPDPNEPSGPATFGAKESIPLKFSDPARTKFITEVQEGGGSQDFALKGK